MLTTSNLGLYPPEEHSISQGSSPRMTEDSSPPTAVTERRAVQLVNPDGSYKYSCVVCATRKIKCDRTDPCGNCVKAGSVCIYRAPAPPRRRRKGMATESSIVERLKRAEKLLAEQRGSTTAMTNIMWRLSDVQLDRSGHLINNNNSTRYLDNSMWIWLNEELRDIRSDLEDDIRDSEDSQNGSEDEDELPLGSMLHAASPKSVSLSDLHPSPLHVLQLWQLYLRNVHPLVKLLHSHTVQEQIVEAASHLHNVPKPLECLMFCLYYLVTMTLSEEECHERFSDNRSAMLRRHRNAAQKALLRADYLTSYHLMVLQAYLMYLIALRPEAPPATMWALSGIAVRMGHRMGLHRDGELLALPLFDVEIRRRLWWEIIFFDSRTAQISGTGGISLSKGVEYKSPRNVNDSELFPGMTSPPVVHEGVTDMLHTMVRIEVGKFLLSFPQQTGTFDGSWQGVAHSSIAAAEKDKLIDDLETRIDRKFISKCDPAVPQHQLAIIISRSAIAYLRFMAHNPRRSARNAATSFDSENEQLLIDCAYKILESTVFIVRDPNLRRFLFYIRTHFQFAAMVYLLKILRIHPSAEHAERIWQIIHAIYEIEPPIFPEAPAALYTAICDLTISAWEAWEETNPGVERPEYLQKLRISRTSAKIKSASSRAQGTVLTEVNSEAISERAPIAQCASGDTFEVAESQHTQYSNVADPLTNPDSIDWGQWEEFIQANGLDNFDFVTLPQAPGVGDANVGNVAVPDFTGWHT